MGQSVARSLARSFARSPGWDATRSIGHFGNETSERRRRGGDDDDAVDLSIDEPSPSLKGDFAARFCNSLLLPPVIRDPNRVRGSGMRRQ